MADLKFLLCKLAFSFLSLEQWFPTFLWITQSLQGFTKLWILPLLPSPPRTHTTNNFVYIFREFTHFLNIHRPSIDLRLRTPPPAPQRLVFMKVTKWFSTRIHLLHCTPSLKLSMAPLGLCNQVLAPENSREGPPWSGLRIFPQSHLSTHAFFTLS